MSPTRPDNRGHRLRTLADLGNRHMGRRVTIGDVTAVLVGIIPVADRVQLALHVGGRQVFTDAYPADTHVEVHQQPTDRGGVT